MDHGDEDINQILEQFLETCELPDFNPEEELMQFEKFQNVGGGSCGGSDDGGGGDRSSVGEGGSYSYEGGRETGREPRGNDGTSIPDGCPNLPVVPLIEDMEVKNLVSLVEQFERTNDDDDANHWDAPSVPFRRGKNFDELFRATRDGSDGYGWSSGAGGKTRSKNSTAGNLTTGNWQQDLATGKCQQDLATGKCQQDLAIENCRQDLATGKCQQDLAIGKCQPDLAIGKCQQDLAIGKCQQDLATGKCQQDLAAGDWQQDLAAGNWQQDLAAGNWQHDLAADLAAGNWQQDSVAGNRQRDSFARKWQQNSAIEKCQQNLAAEKCQQDSAAGNSQPNLSGETWSQDSAAGNQTQDLTRGNWSRNLSQDSTRGIGTPGSTAENQTQDSTDGNWPSARHAPKKGSRSSASDFGVVLSQKIDDLLAVAMGRNDPTVYAPVVKTPVVYATSDCLRTTGVCDSTTLTTTTPSNSRGQRRRWINVSKTRPASVPALATTASAAVATKMSLPWKIKSMTDYSPTTRSVRWKYILVPRRQLLHGKPMAATLPPPPLGAVRSTKRSVTVLSRWQIGTVEHMKTAKRMNMRTDAPSFSTHIPIATTAGTVVVASKKRSWNNMDWNNGGGGNGGSGNGNGAKRPSPPKRQRFQTNILRTSARAAAAASFPRSVPRGPVETGAETTTIALSKQALENSMMLLIPKNALQCAPAKSFPQTLVARVVTVEAANATKVTTAANHRFFRWISDTGTPKLVVDNNNNQHHHYHHPHQRCLEHATNKGKPCKSTKMERYLGDAANEGDTTHEIEDKAYKPMISAAFASGNFRWASASRGGGELAGTPVTGTPIAERHRRVSASGTWYPPASTVRTPRVAPARAAPEFVCEEVSEADLRAVNLAENNVNLPNLIKVLTFSTPVTGVGCVVGDGVSTVNISGVGRKESMGSYNRISISRDSNKGGLYFILFSLDDKDARQVSVSFPKERLEMFRAYRQYLRTANKRTYNLKLRGWHFITRNSISSLVHTTRSLFSRWKSARIIYFAHLVVPSDKFVGKTRRTGPVTAANIRYVWFAQLSQKIMHVWNNRGVNVDTTFVSAGNLVTRSTGAQSVADVKSEPAEEKSINSVSGAVEVVGEPLATEVAREPFAFASTEMVSSNEITSESSAIASNKIGCESHAPKLTASHQLPPYQSSFVRSHCFKNSLIFSFDGTTGIGLRIPTNEDVTRIVISLFNKQGFAVSYPDASRLTH